MSLLKEAREETAEKQGKKYWRSLQRLLDSPAIKEQLQNEFPPGASEAPDAISRRSMLSLMGASFALAGLVCCRRPEEAIVPYVSQPENVIPGVPKYYATSMPFGTSAYGLLVESHEGRPTKIEGNELHPASRGAANAWMQASLLDLYDPDRSRTALRRTNSADRHQASSWDEFLIFWTELVSALEETGGKGLAVISESYTSPTLSRIATQFQARFPQARWVVYEPVSDENIYEGIRRATGRPYRPAYHFENARTILALEADFLSTDSSSLENTRGFAAGRRLGKPTDEMNRLYVVESTLSLTGAAADHRLRLEASSIAAAAAVLASKLRDLGLPIEIPEDLQLPALTPAVQEKIGLIARELISAGRQSLVLAGRSQPPEVHALLTVVNAALGSIGTTVSFREPKDTAWSNLADFGRLIEEIRSGAVSTLIMLGGNPVYNAPCDFEFESALPLVEHSIHLSPYADETSQRAEWHLPLSHFLEAWGDVRSANGSAGVVQPLIAPLFQSRSTIEVVGALVQDQAVSGYELVRETWMESVLGDLEFEAQWLRVLHDGILPGSEQPSATVQINRNAAGDALKRISPIRMLENDQLEIAFCVSPAVYDGRFANNGWLQELPDPITSLTWDNAAYVSPHTAETYGFENGDMARLEYRDRRIETPVWILPGQANGTVTVSLGYGRTAVGRVGNGVGINMYCLRCSAAPYFEGGLRIEKTGRSYPLAHTQEHWEMEGRDIVREATLTEYRLNPDLTSHGNDGHGPAESGHLLWDEPDYSRGYQWGMAIDLSSCTGCNACVIACQSENNIPIVGKEQVRRSRQMHWLRVDAYYSGDPGDPKVAFQPVPCMHCENAPCEQVCPVGATVHDREGLNAMVYNRCIGTRYCSNNCPYKVRRFNFFNYTGDLPELVQMSMNPDVTVRSRGVMEKCTYCIQRINEARHKAKREDRRMKDGDVRTACQQTCPAEAIVFGNINDLESRVSQAKTEGRNYHLLSELNTKPRTSYLAKLRNPNPEWSEG